MVELSNIFFLHIFFQRLFSNLDGKHQSYKINARFENDTMEVALEVRLQKRQSVRVILLYIKIVFPIANWILDLF